MPHTPFGTSFDRKERNDGSDDAWVWSMYTTPVSTGNSPVHLDAVVDTSWSTLFIYQSTVLMTLTNENIA
jgi:hypothetical protein